MTEEKSQSPLDSSLIDTYILDNEYGKAVEAQYRVIGTTESKYVYTEHIRLFHLLLAMEQIDQAILKGIECAHLCVEKADFKKALFMYSITVILIKSYCNESVYSTQLMRLCYEYCLCQVVTDDGDASKNLNAMLDYLVREFPSFADTTEYESLKRHEFDLLMLYEPSVTQASLLFLIKRQ